ncbi:hypothetical protein OKE80_10465 [Riemerella anatipestifer]|uniref:Uncharacterized protein n=1 Tax=Riemerella anatipestifer TaxID=34085 RepID=A0AAP3AMQ6_RIEAN|nr:hypothetical protein [Riemerella anatipestifer]AZZ58462.1 hypothetical protein AWB57_05080 [Riemerella anatipestifer]MBT0573097.1 hypothetical protein [Riemerella anatipestifer]MCO7319731.1 hypothetical protein [Riemerella anatipestifer]MCQ4156119.1 hypothetical protein [Riemerella anatipestifer]MCQ4181998.1 hypothetical protein [Riemerella anatipestifer]
MKNSKLKSALKNVICKNNKSFEVLGIEEIQTVKGGCNGGPKNNSIGSGQCTSANCQSTNCGWN